MIQKQNNTRKLVLTAFFIALGMILPFITMQVPRIGNMLCPMHIPVILCGFLVGAPYGLIAGIILPLLRSLVFGAPPMMPTAVAMAVELGTYGLLTGLLYERLKEKKWGIYISLVSAMVLGRIVWGIAAMGLYGVMGNAFTFKIFLMQAFVNAIPGIIIQLVLIPVLVYKLEEKAVTGNSYEG